MKKQLRNFADQCINASGIIALLLFWEMAPRVGMVDQQFFPPFSKVILYLWKLAVSGVLYLHVSASLQRIFIGLLFATVIAVPTGFLLGGVFPKLSRKLIPLFKLFEQMNPLCLYMVFMLFFGIGESGKIAIIFWFIIWPILFKTIDGIQELNPLYIKIARSFGSDKLMIFSKVILPGAAPAIFTGIRAGATNAFFILVIAEAMGAYYGLGRLIRGSAFGAAILIAVLGMTMNYFLHLIEMSLLDWKHSSEEK